jgi:hypothetical protein
VAPHPFASVIGQELFQSGIIPADTDFRSLGGEDCCSRTSAMLFTSLLFLSGVYLVHFGKYAAPPPRGGPVVGFGEKYIKWGKEQGKTR